MANCSIDKYDGIKRKNRNPSEKALLSLQMETFHLKRKKMFSPHDSKKRHKLEDDHPDNRGDLELNSDSCTAFDGFILNDEGTSEQYRLKVLQGMKTLDCQSLAGKGSFRGFRNGHSSLSDFSEMEELGSCSEHEEEGYISHELEMDTEEEPEILEPGITDEALVELDQSGSAVALATDSDVLSVGDPTGAAAHPLDGSVTASSTLKRHSKRPAKKKHKKVIRKLAKMHSTPKLKGLQQKEVQQKEMTPREDKDRTIDNNASLQDALADAVDFLQSAFLSWKSVDERSDDENSQFPDKSEKEVLIDTTNIKNAKKLESDVTVSQNCQSSEKRSIAKKLQENKLTDANVIENKMNGQENILNTVSMKNANTPLRPSNSNVRMLDSQCLGFPQADISQNLVNGNMSSNSLPEAFQHHKKSVCNATALQLALMDTVTHWATTGQILFCAHDQQQQDSDEQQISADDTPVNISTTRQQELKVSQLQKDEVLEEYSAFTYVSEISQFYRQISQVNCDTKQLSDIDSNDGVYSKSGKSLLDNEHSSIDTSRSINENSSVSADVVKNETITDTTIDVAISLEMSVDQAEVEPYRCQLNLRLDPTTLQQPGYMTKIFESISDQQCLDKTESGFDSCYTRYTQLLDRAKKHEEEQIQQLHQMLDTGNKPNKIPVGGKAPAAATAASPTVAAGGEQPAKRKYVRRKPTKSQLIRESIMTAKATSSPNTENSSLAGSSADSTVASNVSKADKADKTSNSQVDNSNTSIALDQGATPHSVESNDSCPVIESHSSPKASFRKRCLQPQYMASLRSKRKNLSLRIAVRRENYPHLGDSFVMNATLLEVPYLQGWVRELVYRRSSTTYVAFDVYYRSPDKYKMRSRSDFVKYKLKTGDENLTPAHFDFSKCEHNVGLPYERVRCASQGTGRGAKKKRVVRCTDDDFDFLGFMEDSCSSLDFEGFSEEEMHPLQNMKLADMVGSRRRSSTDCSPAYSSSHSIDLRKKAKRSLSPSNDQPARAKHQQRRRQQHQRRRRRPMACATARVRRDVSSSPDQNVLEDDALNTSRESDVVFISSAGSTVAFASSSTPPVTSDPVTAALDRSVSSQQEESALLEHCSPSRRSSDGDFEEESECVAAMEGDQLESSSYSSGSSSSGDESDELPEEVSSSNESSLHQVQRDTTVDDSMRSITIEIPSDDSDDDNDDDAHYPREMSSQQHQLSRNQKPWTPVQSGAQKELSLATDVSAGCSSSHCVVDMKTITVAGHQIHEAQVAPVLTANEIPKEEEDCYDSDESVQYFESSLDHSTDQTHLVVTAMDEQETEQSLDELVHSAQVPSDDPAWPRRRTNTNQYNDDDSASAHMSSRHDSDLLRVSIRQSGSSTSFSQPWNLQSKSTTITPEDLMKKLLQRPPLPHVRSADTATITETPNAATVTSSATVAGRSVPPVQLSRLSLPAPGKHQLPSMGREGDINGRSCLQQHSTPRQGLAFPNTINYITNGASLSSVTTGGLENQRYSNQNIMSRLSDGSVLKPAHGVCQIDAAAVVSPAAPPHLVSHPSGFWQN